jgi:hypothetical protein
MRKSVPSDKIPGWGVKQIVLALTISAIAGSSLSGCVWFRDRNHEDEQAHMHDFDHDRGGMDHSDHHDDQHVDDPH